MDARWQEELEGLHARIARHFGRAETRERAMLYLAGLTEGSGRRNGRRMAERMGEARPDGAQRLLNAARWDADGVRDDLRDYVRDSLRDDRRGGLVLVEAGFRRKGTASAGVACQLNPSTGRVENCQVGLFLAYASLRGRAFIDRKLYMPQEWVADAERRHAAGVPGEVRYVTRGELARAMLERAFEAGIDAAWVAGGEPYGDNDGLRHWLQAGRRPYAMVQRSRRPTDTGGDVPDWKWRRRMRRHVAFEPVPKGVGNWGGSGAHEWGRVWQGDEATGEGTQWLILHRRPASSEMESAYYRAYVSGKMTLADLAEAAAGHWALEEDLERTRDEVGLGEYEARGWDAWYRHVTLCLLAHAASQVARAAQVKGGQA